MCTCIESRGEVLVLDPLAPPIESAQPWRRLDASQPSAIVVLKPDHVRDVDVFVRRYHARTFGPRLFFRHDIPETELEWIDPGSQLPGGNHCTLRRSGSGRDTAVAARAARSRFRRCPYRPERRAPCVGHTWASRASGAGLASAARSSVRGRDRFPWPVIPALIKCLKLGAATGHWLIILSDLPVELTGVDPLHAMLEKARARAPKAALVCASAENIPFPASSFDQIFCVNAFHHFPIARNFSESAEYFSETAADSRFLDLIPMPQGPNGISTTTSLVLGQQI